MLRKHQNLLDLLMKFFHRKMFKVIVIMFVVAVSVGYYLNLINKKHLGVEFVNALYGSGGTLADLKEGHTDKLLEVAIPEIVNRVSLETNGNRLEYTYYNIKDNDTLKPNIMTVTDRRIEFTLCVNGVDDNTLRGIWYRVKHGKISAFNEATLVPFAVEEDMEVQDEEE